MNIGKRINGRNKRLKTQLVLSFILIFMLILMISLGVIYVRMLSVFQKSNRDSTLREFVQAEYIINTIKSEVSNIYSQLYLNSDVHSFLNYTNSMKDYEIVGMNVEILHELDKIKKINNYIESMYFVKNDGDVVGLTDTNNYSFHISKEDPYFSTKLYMDRWSNDLNKSAKINWYGNIKKSEIGLDLGADGHSLMATAKGLKSDYGTDTANLLIFINESAINDIYKHLTRYELQNIYIVDENNQTISSSHKNKIGEPGEIELSKFSSDNGSFVTRINGEKYMIVYYKIKDSGWLLVNELPLNDYMQNVMTLGKTLAFIFILAVVISIVLSEIWMRKLMLPLLKLRQAMDDIKRGGIGGVIPGNFNNELGGLVKGFNQMSLSIAELMKKNNEDEEKKRYYEIEALRSQINPHFLFNTLNSIKWMAKPIKAKNIENAITYLGEILRPLYNNGGTMCPIAEEIDYVTNYIKIMNTRFGDEIKLSIDIPEPYLDYPILRFILQPLIENSILHGFVSKEYAGEIKIVVRDGKYLQISVIDDGSGITEDRLEYIQSEINLSGRDRELKNGIGIINVHQRIKLHYGSSYGIQIKNRMGREGTEVICTLPLRK